jgi:hypothetical protein
MATMAPQPMNKYHIRRVYQGIVDESKSNVVVVVVEVMMHS